MSVDLDHGFLSQYANLKELQKKAGRRIPKFVFEYLEGGCNDNQNLEVNQTDIRQVELMPEYLKEFDSPDIKTSIFGQEYDAPFGIAPMGLQGLIWPDSPAIMAKAAHRHNIPFILSTVSTASLEQIASITEGRAWFQLYYPVEREIRDDILRRLKASGYEVLVLICDVPVFGYRPWDMKNGLGMPPKMSLRNFLQIAARPRWTVKTLLKGVPNFETMKPYMPGGLNLQKLGRFMDQNFDGRLSERNIAEVRSQWEGKLVLKGIVNPVDAERAIRLGVDGIIVSNHGGRQLDAGQSTIKPMINLARDFGDRITVMMDGGIRSGPDIARCLSCGAEFVFMGRPFMYGAAALGKKGGDHSIAMFKIQLNQVLEQLGCEKPANLSNYLIPESLSSLKS